MNRQQLLKSLMDITKSYNFIAKEPEKYDEDYRKGIEMVLSDINHLLDYEGVYSDSYVLDSIIIIKDRGYEDPETEKEELKHVWEHYEITDQEEQNKYLQQYEEYKINLLKAE
jgi:hypothetical protein